MKSIIQRVRITRSSLVMATVVVTLSLFAIIFKVPSVVTRDIGAQAFVADAINVFGPITSTLNHAVTNTVITMPSTTEPSTGQWALSTVENAIVVPFAYLNKTAQFGYNYAGAIQQNAAEASNFLAMESKYQLNNSPLATQKVVETHLGMVDTTGVERRMYTTAAAWDGGFGNMQLNATKLTIADWAGVQQAQFNAGFFATSVPVLFDTAVATKFQIKNGAAISFAVADTGNSLAGTTILTGTTSDVLSVTNSTAAGPTSFLINSNGHTATTRLNATGVTDHLEGGGNSRFFVGDALDTLFYTKSVGVYENATGFELAKLTGTTGLRMLSGAFIKWAASATASSGAADTGLSRNAAGVVEVNSSAAGTLRDLIARRLTAQITSDTAAGPGMSAGCGTGATVTTGNSHFTVTTNATALGTCTLTFGVALNSATPTCTVTSRNAIPVVYTANATTVALSTGLVGGQLYDVACWDH